MFRNLALSVGLLSLLMPLAAQTPAAPAKPVIAIGPNGVVASAKPPGPMGTISGIVVRKGSRTPIEGVQLTMVGPKGSGAGSRSDPEGKFEVKVPPGGYQITARRAGQSGFIGVPTVEVVTVRQDEVTKAEIALPQAAELSGRVLDAHGEPVQGARVTLLMRSYEVWSTNLVFVDTPFKAQTNDLGEYFFEGVPTGMAFHAFAEIVTPGTAEALASNAANPDLRRPILAGTFYPRSLDPGGAQSITLGEGEKREGVDIEMVQTKSYCAQDVLLPGPPGDKPYTIIVDLKSIVSGVFNGYGSFRTGRVISLDKNGRARVCGLWPGSYRFTVQPQAGMRGTVGIFQPQGDGVQPTADYYGSGEFIVTDSDLTSIPAMVGPTFDWQGEVVLDGPAPTQQIEQRMSVGFTNITPTSLATNERVDIPGTFTLKNVHFDRELIHFLGLPDGWYVKSAMYQNDDLTDKGGRFYLDKPDVPLKVTVATNGSRIKVKVTDENGDPVPGRRVSLVPGGLSSAQELTARLWNCYSNDMGECSVFSLPNETPRTVFAPGDYMVLAAELPYNQSADVLEQIWRTLQTDGTKVTLPPGSTGEASIKPTVLR